MKKRIAQKLYDNLNDPKKYPKTKHNLRDSTGFCCIGVLCDMHSKSRSKNIVPYKWNKSSSSDSYFYNKNKISAPDDVLDWAGLYVHDEEEMINLNDDNDTFKEVRKYIKKNFL